MVRDHPWSEMSRDVSVREGSTASSHRTARSPRRGRSVGELNATVGFKALSLNNMRITSLHGLGTQPDLQYAYLRGNQLRSFEHLGVQPNLVELHVQSNLITTFAGMARQPKLELLCLEGNPLADAPNLPIMALLCCGSSLRRVDSYVITSTDRAVARKVPEAAAYAVSCGWMLELTTKRSYEEYMAIAERLREGLAPGQPPINPPPPPVAPMKQTLSAGLEKGRDLEVAARPQSEKQRPPSPPHPLDFSRRPTRSPSTSHHQPDRSTKEMSLSMQRAVHNVSAVAAEFGRTSPRRLHSSSPPGDVGEQVPASALLQLQQTIAGLQTALAECNGDLHQERKKCRMLLEERKLATDVGNCGISMGDMGCIAEVSFGQGIRVHSSVQFSTAVGQVPRKASSEGTTVIPNAFLTIDATHLTLSHFFNRVKVGSIPISSILNIKLDLPAKVLFFTLEDEAMFEVICESEAKLLTIFKVLHFRMDRVPPLYEPRYEPGPIEVSSAQKRKSVGQETSVHRIVERSSSAGSSSSSSSTSRGPSATVPTSLTPNPVLVSSGARPKTTKARHPDSSATDDASSSSRHSSSSSSSPSPSSSRPGDTRQGAVAEAASYSSTGCDDVPGVVGRIASPSSSESDEDEVRKWAARYAAGPPRSTSPFPSGSLRGSPPQ